MTSFGPELLRYVFRAGSAYDLVLYDRLSEEERRALAEVAREPGFYGVLRPRGEPGRGLKSADHDTALLLLTLREPGPLPAYALARLGEGAERTIARFVADGVLEIEHDGAFVSGPAALALFTRQDTATRPPGTDSAPCFTAFVASSCTTIASGCAAVAGSVANVVRHRSRVPVLFVRGVHHGIEDE